MPTRLKYIALAALTVGLAACVPGQQQRMQTQLNYYVGQSVAEFVADHGPPAAQVKLAANEEAFRFVITAPGIGAVIPMGESLIVAPPSPRVCNVQLRAKTSSPHPELQDWIIQRWNWQGAC